jgi:predicted MFS family arabinose efflux permease
LVIFLLLGVGAAASIVVRNRPAAPLIALGSAVLIAGVAVTLFGLYLGQPVVLFAGALVAGVGLGPAFSAVVRMLTPLAPPEQRAALLAAIFVTVYVSFSVPAVLAGVFTNAVGLRATTYGYGVVVGVLAAITTIVVARRTRAARLNS